MEGMKNLDIRVYRETIKAAIAAERAADPNWSWGIRSLKKGIVHISWGYLDYIGETECFTVEVLQDEENGDITVYGTGGYDSASPAHNKRQAPYALLDFRYPFLS